MFGDIGEGVISDSGDCYVWLDPVFAETVESYGYQVFLQPYGRGEYYVSERKSAYFVSLVVLGLGIIVGMIGSSRAVRKYLKI